MCILSQEAPSGKIFFIVTEVVLSVSQRDESLELFFFKYISNEKQTVEQG